MWHKLKFVLQKYLVVGLNFILQFVLFKKFDVRTAGMLNYGRTIFQYFEYTNIGLRHTIDKRKFKDNRSISQLIGAARFVELLVAALLVVVVFVFDRQLWVLGFLFSGLLYAYLFYIKSHLRNTMKMEEYIRLSFIFDVVPAGMLTVGVLSGNFTLAVVAFLVGHIVLFIYCSLRQGLKNRIVSDTRYVKAVVRKNFNEGFYLYLSTFLYFVLISGDRFFLRYLFDYVVVAQVSFAMFFFNAFTPLPTALIEIRLKPLLTVSSRKEYIRFFKNILLMTLTFIVGLFFVSHFIIQVFFKKYVDIGQYVNYFSLLLLPHIFFQVTFLVFFRRGMQRTLFYLLLGAVVFYLVWILGMKWMVNDIAPLMLIFIAKLSINILLAISVFFILLKKEVTGHGW